MSEVLRTSHVARSIGHVAPYLVFDAVSGVMPAQEAGAAQAALAIGAITPTHVAHEEW
jgi:hypothetical protein